MLYNVVAVKYLNTYPFLYGLEHSEVINKLKIELAIPSDCSARLLNKHADIGLAPVAILPKLTDYRVITDYCIGASGKVKSVVLFSEVPIREIETIFLDYQSTTSVQLIRILAREHWNMNPEWKHAEKGYEKKIQGKTAGVVIGDRTFGLYNKFSFYYDLAEEWQKLTGLSFVFACWVARNNIDKTVIDLLNQALKTGIEEIESVLKQISDNKIYEDVNLHEYLVKNIDYKFDQKKISGLDLFLHKILNKKV